MYWKIEFEAFHQYEYPGIHIAIFCAVAYINYYAKKLHGHDMTVTSGYRCHSDNEKKRKKKHQSYGQSY